MGELPQFLVVQHGARRAYAVPAILERAGMLERFYTDLAGNVGLGCWLAKGSAMPILGPSLARLNSRQIPSNVIPRTRTFGTTTLSTMLRGALGSKDPSRQFKRHLEASNRLGHSMLEAGFGNATHLFTMLGEGGPLVAEAHRQGLTVVSEVYILLSTECILEEERRAFPDWEPEAADYAAIRRQFGGEDVLLRRTHHFICPSEAVQEDLVSHWGVAREKTALVPYGMNPTWLNLEPNPTKGRILFVGTADLRKGIHYLAMAAEKLQARGRSYEFRVAGNVTDQVRRQPLCRHLNFLGRVPRERIHEEFQQADVFVLPSLAEGSAEVTYEALAAGVPLVVTSATGSVARDGIEGRIVSERDPVVLGDAIESIVEDRNLRGRMACAARERALDYTWERYGDRLVQALTNLCA